MVDLEPFLDAPFAEASNLSFEALLGIGIALLAAVAVLGRSTVTTAAVALYLLLIPGYVWYRIRVWDGDETSDAAESGSKSEDGQGTDGSESANRSGDDGDGDGDGDETDAAANSAAGDETD